MTASIAQTSSTGINVERAYDYRSRNANSDPLRKKIAVALGYKPSDFTGAAADANIGEGCGNPLLIANLKEVCYHVTS